MTPPWPKAAKVLEASEEDVLTYMTFPADRWTRIYSTNPLVGVIAEIKRRTNVVGIFPDQDAVMRLVGSVLIEVSDEWQAGGGNAVSIRDTSWGLHQHPGADTMREASGPARLCLPWRLPAL